MHSPQNGVLPETIGTMPSTIQRIHQTTILLRHRLESSKSANGRIQSRSSSIRRSATSFWSPMHRSHNWNYFLESLGIPSPHSRLSDGRQPTSGLPCTDPITGIIFWTQQSRNSSIRRSATNLWSPELPSTDPITGISPWLPTDESTSLFSP